jgi:hypothetical protein
MNDNHWVFVEEIIRGTHTSIYNLVEGDE